MDTVSDTMHWVQIDQYRKLELAILRKQLASVNHNLT